MSSVDSDRAPRSAFSPVTRRDLLTGAGSLGLLSLLGTAGLPLRALAQAGSAPGLVFPLERGPYQNNGASPWYATLPLGTPGQSLKYGMDTGSNFIWVTSSLCAPDGCQHYGGKRFEYQKSSSFHWLDRTDQTVSFGPWGSMTVQLGRDVFGLPGGATSPTNLYLAKSYSGPQFQQLDWDGGIGLPAGTCAVQAGISNFVGDLMNAGLVDPELPYISFDTDFETKKGSCRIGGVDPEAFDPHAGIWMEWRLYTSLPGVGYLWSTPLEKYVVGSTVVAEDVTFCLDSGSSEFKGDDEIMNATLRLINASPVKPPVTLVLGESVGGGRGKIVVPPSVYEVLIEAGPDKGKVVPQFTPLGLPGLVLVGSVVMDLFYTIFEFDVAEIPGGYFLTPKGMWLFEKPGSPGRLGERAQAPSTAGRRKPLRRASRR